MAIQTRAAATRQKLIDAAVEQFSDNGYLETTPQGVAAAAGLTTGALYYHFKSTEDLAAAIINEGWPRVAPELGGYLNTPDSA